VIIFINFMAEKFIKINKDNFKDVKFNIKVKVNKEKFKYLANPIASDIDQSLRRGNFKTEEDAWDYIKTVGLCNDCLDILEKGYEEIDEFLRLDCFHVSQTRCGTEWEVIEYLEK